MTFFLQGQTPFDVADESVEELLEELSQEQVNVRKWSLTCVGIHKTCCIDSGHLSLTSNSGVRNDPYWRDKTNKVPVLQILRTKNEGQLNYAPYVYIYYIN